MACPGGVHREGPPHFVLVPLLSPGHMIPMVDMARGLAAHGAVVSVVTTPVNAARIGDAIRRCADSVHFIELPFPCREVGLPDGCENLDLLSSRSLFPNFHRGARMLLEPLERRLREESRPAPSFVVSDSAFPWSQELARSFGVPWLLFHGFCCFALLCQHNLHEHMTHLRVASDSEPFVLPGLRRRIEVTRAQLPGAFSSNLKIQDIREQIRNGELAADGFVVNSFAELEPAFVHDLEEATGKKVWTVGPLSLCNKKALDMAERGDKASIDIARCLKWLDSMDPGSVVYASFGSVARLAKPQLTEIGLGLEASGHPFIWVLKIRGEKASREVEQWLEEEGFEERNRTKGLLIRGWAPQLLILSHAAVGGFVTHCGWNSTLEGVCAGVPMVSWPLFGEQFLNEKLIGEILGVAVGLGVEYSPVVWTEEDKAEVLVRREAVARAVASLMDGGEEAAERRRGTTLDLRVAGASEAADDDGDSPGSEPATLGIARFSEEEAQKDSSEADMAYRGEDLRQGRLHGASWWPGRRTAKLAGEEESSGGAAGKGRLVRNLSPSRRRFPLIGGKCLERMAPGRSRPRSDEGELPTWTPRGEHPTDRVQPAPSLPQRAGCRNAACSHNDGMSNRQTGVQSIRETAVTRVSKHHFESPR